MSAVQVTYEELVRLRAEAPRLRGERRGAGLRPGERPAATRGRGLEFEEARPYQPGDDFRAIDWRVTARTGRPFTKRFREERERTLHFVVGCGPAMAFGSRRVFKSVAAARAAALLAWGAPADAGIGGLFYGAGPRCVELAPRGGEVGVRRLLMGLARARPAAEDAPRAGAATALALLRRRAAPGSRVYLIGDLADLDAACEPHLAALGRRCALTAVHVHDPLERELPADGRYRFSDGAATLTLETGGQARRRAWREGYDTRIEALRARLVRYGAGLVLLATDRPELEALRAPEDRLG